MCEKTIKTFSEAVRFRRTMYYIEYYLLLSVLMFLVAFGSSCRSSRPAMNVSHWEAFLHCANALLSFFQVAAFACLKRHEITELLSMAHNINVM